MVARVGTLAVATRFETLLTGRKGLVLAQDGLSVAVLFDDRSDVLRELHRDVRVKVLEITH